MTKLNKVINTAFKIWMKPMKHKVLQGDCACMYSTKLHFSHQCFTMSEMCWEWKPLPSAGFQYLGNETKTFLCEGIPRLGRIPTISRRHVTQATPL